MSLNSIVIAPLQTILTPENQKRKEKLRARKIQIPVCRTVGKADNAKCRMLNAEWRCRLWRLISIISAGNTSILHFEFCISCVSTINPNLPNRHIYQKNCRPEGTAVRIFVKNRKIRGKIPGKSQIIHWQLKIDVIQWTSIVWYYAHLCPFSFTRT